MQDSMGTYRHSAKDTTPSMAARDGHRSAICLQKDGDGTVVKQNNITDVSKARLQKALGNGLERIYYHISLFQRA